MADTDNLIREVNEEIRRERLLRIWREFGTYIIGAAMLVIVCVAGYRYWDYSRVSAAGGAGASYLAAVQAGVHGKPDEALKGLEAVVKAGNPGFATLAQLKVAGLEAKKGHFDEAVAIYDRVAKDAATDSLIVGFAKLQAAMLRLGTADWTEMQNRLKDLRDDSSPYKVSARELYGIAAYKNGKTEEARRSFEQVITDKKAPQSAGDRARIMMLVLTEGEIVKTAPPPVLEKKSGEPVKKDGVAPSPVPTSPVIPGGPAATPDKADKSGSAVPVPGTPTTETAPAAPGAGETKADTKATESKASDTTTGDVKAGDTPAPPSSVAVPAPPPGTEAKKEN